MATGKRLIPKKSGGVPKALKIVYIVIAVLAFLVVAGFAVSKVLIQAPDVPDQVTFSVITTAPPVSSAGADSSAETAEPGDVVVFTRRPGVYTCLLLGVANQGGSDTIMLGCFDTNEKTASLISIPRDTLVRVDGTNSKINALYTGGEDVDDMVNTVSGMLGVPIDFWMSVNLSAFRKIVDTIGGVYFDVPVNMNYDDPYQNLSIHISKGYQKLNGTQAEGVMRCRNCYSNADLGRVETQRAFLAALVEQTITLSNVTKVTELINILSEYVKTNMPLDNMLFFAKAAIGMDLDADLTGATLPGTWRSPYEEIDDEAALELVNELLPVYTEPVTSDIMNIYHR